MLTDSVVQCSESAQEEGNGKNRPIPDHAVLTVERPLRSVERSLTSKKLEATAFGVVGGDPLRLGVYRNLPKRWSAFATDNTLVGGKAFQCYVPEQTTYDVLIAQPPGSAPMAITLHAEGITPHTRLFSVDPAIVQAMGEMLTAREKAPVARF